MLILQQYLKVLTCRNTRSYDHDMVRCMDMCKKYRTWHWLKSKRDAVGLLVYKAPHLNGASSWHSGSIQYLARQGQICFASKVVQA